MKLNTQSPLHVLLFSLILIFQFSCSKDSDLLAEYVIADAQKAILIDDIFVVSLNGSTVLDVLANDTFESEEEVVITETSTPTNGTVEINSDNTLTYTPETTEETEDSFTYTTEVVNTNETVSTETSNVTVTLTEDPNKTSQSTDMGELKAFPGAKGFGKNTTGGRGGIIVEVTNLNDSGSGSLREALKLTQKRTIIFKVGGTIKCDSYLSIPKDAGNLTIAGQTAPGGGITIKGAELRIQASNVIARHIRIRMGKGTSGSNLKGINIVSYSGNKISDIILDHVSVSWAANKSLVLGEVVEAGGSVTNCTIQNSIVGEAQGNGYNVLLYRNARNISYINNFNVFSTDRNIRSSVKSNSYEMLNNYIYNYKTGSSPTYENHFDIIGNNWETGSANQAYETIRLEASSNNSPDALISLTKGYINDNLYNGKEATISPSLNPYLNNSRVINSGYNTFPASEVKNKILGITGAGNGTIQGLDSVDKYYINHAKNGTGSRRTDISDSDFPSIANGTPYTDSDKDGLSDDWEEANGLNPNDISDGNKDRNNDGFTNFEDFLHSLTL